MPIRKKTTRSLRFSWKSEEVECYYESALLVNLDHCKFYNSFVLKDTHYKVGDFAFIRTDIGPQQICSLECLYEVRGNGEAVVNVYEFAVSYEENFRRINVEFDEENEVVFKAAEKDIISLNNITGKCRVIFGCDDETVSAAIDDCNLNRKIYFLCRYKYIQDDRLIPVLSGTVINDISVVEEADNSFSNETPLRIVSDNRKPCPKKSLSESMDIYGNYYVPRLDQVKKNLNKSFNDSLHESESIMNYSIVEHADEDILKIKLRVSNGKVLSNIPATQPIVLADRMDKFTTRSERDAIYEVKSPVFRSLLEEEASKTAHKKQISTKLSNDKSGTPKIISESEETFEVMSNFNAVIQSEIGSKSNLKKGRTVSYKEPETPEKASKLSDLSNMVRNLKLNEKSPIKLSPRKLRKLSKPLYYHNYSDSDSENYPQRRKSVRNRDRISIRNYAEQHTDESDTRSFDDSQEPEIILIDTKESESERNIGKRKSVRRKLEITENQYNQTQFQIDTSKLSQVISRENISAGNKINKISKNTPLKLIREGFLTPSMDQRKHSVVKANTPLILARNNLHVSYVPTVLPCREKEYADVYNFIEGKLFDKCGGCMYISGVPGTGKTATVTVAIENLIASWKQKDYPLFNFVSVNGMRLTEPRQCYVEILKQLSNKRLPWEQALSVLEEKFTTKSSKKVVPTVLLVDELDILCTKRQDVVYNLLDWPTKANAQLIVVTIANTMDLPERLLMSRVTSRLGLTRLTFQAYTHKQLQEIVLNRLTGNSSFKSDAVQFVARKVASVSGDARRALDICRRSAEIAEMEGPNTQVTMKHVNAALDAMITQPKVKAITHCSRLEKLLLQSIIAEVERTGIEETVFGDVYTMLVSLAALEGFKMVSASLVASAVYRLSSSRLLLIDQKCIDFNQRIILNVSADDVYYALKND